MNSHELNKFLGAVLGACLCALAIHLAAGAIFAPVAPRKLSHLETKAAMWG